MKSTLLALLRGCGRVWCRLHGVDVSSSAFIHGFPRFTRKEGASITLDEGATINAAIWSNPYNDGRRTILFAGPSASIRFCRNAGVSASRIIAYSRITIGENSLIGAGCLICDSDMHEVPLGSGKDIRISPVVIGARVFVGANATILKGVTVGDGAVIGANSVVTSDIPPNMLAAGNPARPIRRV